MANEDNIELKQEEDIEEGARPCHWYIFNLIAMFILGGLVAITCEYETRDKAHTYVGYLETKPLFESPGEILKIIFMGGLVFIGIAFTIAFIIRLFKKGWGWENVFKAAWVILIIEVMGYLKGTFFP